MAVNSSRSMNADLQKGVRDGTFKNITPDRESVEVQPLERAHQLQCQYNVADYVQNLRPENCLPNY